MSFQNLLLPTDFSPSSKNSIAYGIQLAHALKIKTITLVHVYAASNAIANQPIISASIPSMLLDKQYELEKLKEKIESDNQTKVETLLLEGKVTELTHDLIKEKGIDLIIMGISDKSKIEQTLIGSNAINVMRKTTCPVIVIPEKYKWAPIDNIVLSIDITQNPNDLPEKTIKDFYKQAEAENLYLVNVEEDDDHSSHIQNPNIEKINFNFNELKAKLDILPEKNKQQAIEKYCEAKNAALLVLIERKYDIFTTIFHKSLTRQLAYDSNLPIMVLESTKL